MTKVGAVPKDNRRRSAICGPARPLKARGRQDGRPGVGQRTGGGALKESDDRDTLSAAGFESIDIEPAVRLNAARVFGFLIRVAFVHLKQFDQKHGLTQLMGKTRNFDIHALLENNVK
jgi:hypothetical protein